MIYSRSRYGRQTARNTLVLFGIMALLHAMPALAQVPDEPAAIDWLTLLMGLFGGLAMFLFGMEQMSEGLKAAAGDTLKDVLARLTKNRIMGAITGAFVTAVLNSSSVTTVLVVGFITAGFMSLAQSVGIIMGANIGSTFTAQIVAFNVTQYALIMVTAGFFMLFTSKQEKTRHYGAMIMGLGLVFYGMGVMGDAMNPLRTYQPFIDLMGRMENPLLGILIGAVFTGLVQSSAATTGIAIVMATGGLITLPAGIALAFGANIGTCVTALLAAIGKPTDAVRAAVVHILFNVAGVLVWVLFIPQLADFVTAISPAAPELTGKARMAAEVPRQIANAHTVFNVANTLLFLGFTTTFARLVERLVPEKAEVEKIIVRPRFLDSEMLQIPSMALERVRFEIGHMGEIITEMLARLDEVFLQRDRQKLEAVAKMDDKVDILNEAILEYLSEIRQHNLTEHQSTEFQSLMSATVNLESLADIIETDLADIGKDFLNTDIRPSETTRLLLRELADKVILAVANLVRAISENDETAAAEVIALKDDIRILAQQALQLQSERIAVKEPGHLQLVQMEMEILEHLRRIYTLAKRVAKDFVPEEVASHA
ncbi:MAG: Na/Pi cotransporter family protein [Gammaproteobacteria bacterium]|jgi:phosphate:Na+ symporter